MDLVADVKSMTLASYFLNVSKVEKQLTVPAKASCVFHGTT